MDLDTLTKQYDFTGRTIVVTGGAGVLGGEMACALVGCRANVAILDRDPERVEAFQARLGLPGGRARVYYADVLELDSLNSACQSVLSDFGSVDGLINAAGGNHPAATTGPDLSFFDLPRHALEQVLDLNLLGTVLPSQVFGRIMARQCERGADSGIILNISSMNAYRPLTRVPAYSAAKAAISNFTAWLAVHMAQEYSPRLRVNALAPGFFHTSQNHFLLYDDSGDLTERGRTILEHTPMNRFGEAEDLLGAMLWLLSPASCFVTGIVLPVDGGFSAFSGV